MLAVVVVIIVGGCCRICGSVEHFKRDCPDMQSQQGEYETKPYFALATYRKLLYIDNRRICNNKAILKFGKLLSIYFGINSSFFSMVVLIK